MSLPILRLKVAGYCSPLTSCSPGNDAAMAHAACALQSLPVYWYRRVKPNNATSANVSNTKLEDESLLSPLPLLKRKMSCFGRSISSLSSESNSVPDDEIYVKFDAVLSVCDTDSGPAIELRTISKTFAGMLEKYELADINEKMDEITHLPASLNSFPILERIIPLSMIECAALGGKWDLEKFLNVGGTVDCGIKVYSCKLILEVVTTLLNCPVIHINSALTTPFDFFSPTSRKGFPACRTWKEGSII